MIPRATYRLQFHRNFPFEAVQPLASYLRQLGISHVYSSPILKARAGSMHGYDVVDHSRINPELGGEKEFRRLAETLRNNGLGIILDIVPNHMAVDSENSWWMDVLQHGRVSRFADYFDIDWDTLGGKILAPFLGRPYWQTLEAGEISLARQADGTPVLRYFDRVLPIRPEDHEIDFGAFSTGGQFHELLERQHYRLAWWRTTNDTINWRRFFDVSDLIAINQETDGVFEATHAKIFELYREGLIDGLRIDHVDGLTDPTGYCQRLRSRLDELGHLRSSQDPHPYIVVEKILAPGETLPPNWPVDGTTGYDFMNQISALQHNPAGSESLKMFWHQISSRPAEFEPEEELARAQIVTASFESALMRVAEVFGALAQSSKSGRDISSPAIRRGLVCILQQLRIYRTYATEEADSPPPGLLFEAAVRKAQQHANAVDRPAIGFIAEVMRGEIVEAEEAVRRFNQLSAPVAAKAVEDTAFYRYGRLLSRNDVGFDPGNFAISATEFHAAVEQRSARVPHSMLATATHDHKRGEDVRPRLAVLSEIPVRWMKAVEGWIRLNAAQRPAAVQPGDEYQLYQTLAGIWPLNLKSDDKAGISALCERVVGWQEKALREAKLRTSWLDPDGEFECANKEFVRAILDCDRSSEFLESMCRFVECIAPAGALNGLVQVVLRCTLPGVPDCYQGTEFWDLSLVDPDNRGAVDFATRIRALEQPRPPTGLLPQWRDGRVKQAVLSILLHLRNHRPTLFESGTYQPLQTRGSRSANVLAFARGNGEEAIVVALPLRCAAACAEQPLPAGEFWEDTEIVLPQSLQGRGWQSLFGGNGCVAEWAHCATLFANFPAAVLV
jgi:(1->4)-alpha-D-glucan 1-alpha-D-glucosylmutase